MLSLRAGYGSTNVLEGIDLELERGRIHGLVGLNASGKTTLFDTIAGLLQPTAGRLSLGEECLRPDHVAYLPAELHFYPRLTGRDYLEVFRAARPRTAIAFDIERWASVFDLQLDMPVEDYSEGMRRKVALIGVVSMQRPVLLLDEPSNALDIEASALLADLLRGLAAGGTIIVIASHILEALTDCERIHRLAGGRIAGSYWRDERARLVADLSSRQMRDRRALLGELAGQMAWDTAAGPAAT